MSNSDWKTRLQMWTNHRYDVGSIWKIPVKADLLQQEKKGTIQNWISAVNVRNTNIRVTCGDLLHLSFIDMQKEARRKYKTYYHWGKLFTDIYSNIFLPSQVQNAFWSVNYIYSKSRIYQPDCFNGTVRFCYYILASCIHAHVAFIRPVSIVWIPCIVTTPGSDDLEILRSWIVRCLSLMILWQIWWYFRYERCYSTVEYGFGVCYATIFQFHGTNLTVKNTQATKLLRNRSNGKCNRGGRCLLFQAQTVDLRGDRHRDRQRGGNPCGGGVEYLHRDPASRRWRRKGKSQIWDSKIRSRVPRGWDPRMTALARTSSNCKRQTRPLVRESAPYRQTRNCLTVIKIWS
jgi:hypothetical protein